MKRILFLMVAGLTLILGACGTQTSVLSPAVVGAADNSDAQLSLEDKAYYYDFGEVKAGSTGYPLAFRVDIPAEEIAEVKVNVFFNEGFIVNSTGDYQQGELFTIMVDTAVQPSAVPFKSASLTITGKTISGKNFETVFIAVAEIV
jgi:hypothetical protein